MSCTACQLPPINCGTDSTPLWRRSPHGAIICNACGIYLRSKNSARPSKLYRSAPRTSPITSYYVVPAQRFVTTGDSLMIGCLASILGCQNCGTKTTPIWRRDENDLPACNACGLYLKSHGHPRPKEMWSSRIRRRTRDLPTDPVPPTDPAASPPSWGMSGHSRTDDASNATGPPRDGPYAACPESSRYLPPPLWGPSSNTLHRMLTDGGSGPPRSLSGVDSRPARLPSIQSLLQ
ncbi:hypothetical protein BO70DRAFT_381384 [Aspergillus heteromorphus CBS 117.55]|uniref:GATA-type domain-containing protein n=1 Tax=Aspergillus heteromorphus CBS 117.55 TaxID=1448321 RepID=A0A317VK06_9EURO|nr:uncharacterized protein BO70DRAFT_381384 [Aspergillus heteromorphus CBS 117.55]PWY74275.1 hypothetical protein BO70DRAFT_381384 [Aspergillus heteromorphus CBS 117.55]